MEIIAIDKGVYLEKFSQDNFMEGDPIGVLHIDLSRYGSPFNLLELWYSIEEELKDFINEDLNIPEKLKEIEQTSNLENFWDDLILKIKESLDKKVILSLSN